MPDPGRRHPPYPQGFGGNVLLAGQGAAGAPRSSMNSADNCAIIGVSSLRGS